MQVIDKELLFSDSQDVDLDAILGELCALENQYDAALTGGGTGGRSHSQHPGPKRTSVPSTGTFHLVLTFTSFISGRSVHFSPWMWLLFSSVLQYNTVNEMALLQCQWNRIGCEVIHACIFNFLHAFFQVKGMQV